MPCSPNPTGAITLLVACHQGKLAYNYDIAPSFLDILVHYTVLVIKDAQTNDFSCQPFYIFLIISIFYTKQDKEAVTNLSLLVAFDCHAGMCYSLYDCSHIIVLLYAKVV